MVEHAAWRADHDVRAAFERVDLRTIFHAAIDGYRAQTLVAAQLLGFLKDLLGQFARRDQDQRLAGVARGIEALEHRQDEGACLAATRTGLDHHVAFGKQIGDGARLDGHQVRPACADGGLAQRGGESVEGQIGQDIGLSLSGFGDWFFHVVLVSV